MIFVLINLIFLFFFDWFFRNSNQMSTIQTGDFNSNCRRLKIVLLGERSVGKSSIIRRFTSNNFQELMSPTVGVDFMTKHLNYKNINYKLELWDTAGQQKYRSLIKGYLKGADVCIFVYDVTRLQSYKALVEWIHIFESVSTSDSFKIIARNKIDLEDDSQAIEKQKKFIKSNHKQLQQLNEMSISAKTGFNIQELFQEILHQSWFSKTMQDIGTTRTIKSIKTQKHLSNMKKKYGNCCN